MDSNVLTISLGSWMELPNADYRAWEQRDSMLEGMPCLTRDCRASSGSVARYYAEYVKAKGLGRFFRNGCVVTSVRPLEQVPCAEVRRHVKCHLFITFIAAKRNDCQVSLLSSVTLYFH